MVQCPDLIESHLRSCAFHKIRDQDGFWKLILTSGHDFGRTCVRVLVVARMKLVEEYQKWRGYHRVSMKQATHVCIDAAHQR